MKTRPALSFKERQRQERHAEILRAARAVFNERGYAGTSMDEIAERVGIGKGTLYLHFPSKDDLVVAFWEEAVSQAADRIEQIVAAEGGALDKIEQVLRLMAQSMEQNGEILWMATPEVRALLQERVRGTPLLRTIFGRIADLVRAGQASGEIDPRLVPEILVAMLPMLALLPLRCREFNAGQPLDKELVLQTILRVLCQGITGPAVSRDPSI
jgi:AcrR family transcriptional regulator